MEDLKQYYRERAGEYESLYDNPERQDDLVKLEEYLCEKLAGRRVLEVACGTGYWTERVSDAAESVLAVDAAPEMLEIARSKHYPGKNVSFAVADVFDMRQAAGITSEAPFSAALGEFWWSHVPGQHLEDFLCMLHTLLSVEAVVCFCDNRYVEGSSTPISHEDSFGNTYQLRRLSNGHTYSVIKNFPTSVELREVLSGLAKTVEIREFAYYWAVTYTLG